MMKKEDLVIGRNYTTIRFGEIATLSAFHTSGSIILTPISGFKYMAKNNPDDMRHDPQLKPGTFSLSLDIFLKTFKEVE